MENEGSLCVLLFEVFHGLWAENPVFRFEIRLEDGRSEVLVAGDVDNVFHVL